MKLFEPIKFAGLESKNRVMFPPMVSRRATMDNFVTQDTKELYMGLAKGGAGIVVVEMTFIFPSMPLLLAIYDDAHTKGFKEMLDEIRKESDAIMFIQIGDAIPGLTNIEEVKPEMIEIFIGAFINAAVNAKKAGFDGIEIHAAHGYMISGFLSLRNKRKDEYGKTLEGRMLLLKRIIEGCRQACGNDYPIAVRINGEEFIVGGNTLKQTTKIAPKLADMGIAYLSVSAGGKMQDAWNVIDTQLKFPYPKPGPWPTVEGYSGHRCVPPNYMADCCNVFLAEAIKESLVEAGHADLPVITAGKIRTAEQAEKILQTGKADIIGICRPIMCDHEWPIKVREGRFNEIRKCAYCNYCMEGARLANPNTSCIKWKKEGIVN